MVCKLQEDAYAPRFKSIAIYAAALPMVALMGCGSSDLSKADDLPAVNVENFTTEGKPTKTVQTPWGDKQVYDPTQDAEVIEAYTYVEKQNVQGSAKDQKTLSTYRKLFKEVRQIQFNDMLRTGCVAPYSFESDCQTKPNYIKNDIPKSCPLPDFGIPNLSSCEQEFLSTNTEDPIAETPLGCRKVNHDYFDEIGSRELEDGFGDDGIDAYFSSYCISYDGKIYSNKWRPEE